MKEAKVNKAEEVNRRYKSWIYTIRRSNRAKRLRLNITVKDGLVVVLPKGFNEKEIPDILSLIYVFSNQSPLVTSMLPMYTSGPVGSWALGAKAWPCSLM